MCADVWESFEKLEKSWFSRLTICVSVNCAQWSSEWRHGSAQQED
jgi:hypothetical protein